MPKVWKLSPAEVRRRRKLELWYIARGIEAMEEARIRAALRPLTDARARTLTLLDAIRARPVGPLADSLLAPFVKRLGALERIQSAQGERPDLLPRALANEAMGELLAMWSSRRVSGKKGQPAESVRLWREYRVTNLYDPAAKQTTVAAIELVSTEGIRRLRKRIDGCEPQLLARVTQLLPPHARDRASGPVA